MKEKVLILDLLLLKAEAAAHMRYYGPEEE